MFMRTFTYRRCSARGPVYAVSASLAALRLWRGALPRFARDMTILTSPDWARFSCKLRPALRRPRPTLRTWRVRRCSTESRRCARRPCADHGGHPDIKVLDPVLAVEVGRARKDALLVLEKALRHGDGRRRRRVEGRPALEQVDDLGAAVARALDDLVEPRLRGPFHLDQIG